MKARNVLAASIAAALSMGAVQSAEAAYAYSYQDIWNFTISAGGNILPADFVNDVTQTYNSDSSASRHDTPSESTGERYDAGRYAPDTDFSFSGSGVGRPANNSCRGANGAFTGGCSGKSGDYGYGDAQIYDTFPGAPVDTQGNPAPGNGDFFGGAWNVAEAYAGDEDGTFQHEGQASVSLDLDFVAQTDGEMAFSWDWLVELLSDVVPGTTAEGYSGQAVAGVSFSIGLLENNQVAGAVLDLPILQNFGVTSTYDAPLQQNASNSGSVTNAYIKDIFSAGNNFVFTAGEEYSLRIRAGENAQVQQQVPTSVPVPASLALMGLGLAGFGASRRMKRS